jgi:hypothetical protein
VYVIVQDYSKVADDSSAHSFGVDALGTDGGLDLSWVFSSPNVAIAAQFWVWWMQLLWQIQREDSCRNAGGSEGALQLQCIHPPWTFLDDRRDE